VTVNVINEFAQRNVVQHLCVAEYLAKSTALNARVAVYDGTV